MVAMVLTLEKQPGTGSWHVVEVAAEARASSARDTQRRNSKCAIGAWVISHWRSGGLA